jgi:restriction-modification enzyme MmeI-like protein
VLWSSSSLLLRRAPSWEELTEPQRRAQLSSGLVASDYPGQVAADWRMLLSLVEQKVKPERDRQDRKALRERWWQYADKRPGLYRAIGALRRVLVTPQTSPHLAFAFAENGLVYGQSLIVFPYETAAAFAVLQSRVHEVWVRFFSSSMKDDLRYAPTDCFETYPLPRQLDGNPQLESASAEYLTQRSEIMVGSDLGMTALYNLFHNAEHDSDAVARLREMHSNLDHAVLRAYDWPDLVDAAQPTFRSEEDESEHSYQERLFWPPDLRDEVLSRLLEMNKRRGAEQAQHALSTAERLDDDAITTEAAE